MFLFRHNGRRKSADRERKKTKVVIARGFHLFPFRTEKLNPAAPMVLRKWESRSPPPYDEPRRMFPPGLFLSAPATCLLFPNIKFLCLIVEFCFCMLNWYYISCRQSIILENNVCWYSALGKFAEIVIHLTTIFLSKFLQVIG